ncbi:MAG: TlpA disulfide reductase family protein, partial [Halieaceae bacterium]
MKKFAQTRAVLNCWRPSQAFATTLAVMLFFAGGLTLSDSSWAERGSHISLDEPLPQPAWELPLIANGEGTVSPSSFRGRVTYLDFWASWCGPCRLSLPALNRLSQEFAPADFGVIAISVDYVDEDALDFLTR